MAEIAARIAFDHKGIGAALHHHRFTVPMNQREYRWEGEHVRDLLQDLTKAIDNDNPTYFLGTIVLTGGELNEVSDGQQRLATVTILLAAIRDYMYVNDKERVESIEPVYLRERDLDSNQVVAKLRLNVDDNEYFTKAILATPGSPDRAVEPTLESHRRIKQAAELAQEHVEAIIAPLRPQDRVERLIRWVKFLRDGVLVILASVPSHLNAYAMFETLNDRGLKASQADLLKNYLLQRAGNRAAEAQRRWARMLGVLDSLDIEDLTVTYLRHVVILTEGPTKERELYAKVEATVTSQARAITFLDALAESSSAYAAILNPSHSLWNDYPASSRRHVQTLLDLQIQQVRPLIFAIVRFFAPQEAAKALRLCVSWSVRFLIVGRGGGGLLDRNYGLAAQRIGTGAVKTAAELARSMDFIPTDTEFEAAFGVARVSQSHLAKYYLRALELQVKGDPEPELIPNTDEIINLEHVLPENPGSHWPDVDPDTADAMRRRLGNMVLLRAKKNTVIGNKPFAEKKQTLKESAYELTSQVAEHESWGVKEISERQKRLAALAAKTWPVNVI
jgi:hypothetical protein